MEMERKIGQEYPPPGLPSFISMVHSHIQPLSKSQNLTSVLFVAPASLMPYSHILQPLFRFSFSVLPFPSCPFPFSFTSFIEFPGTITLWQCRFMITLHPHLFSTYISASAYISAPTSIPRMSLHSGIKTIDKSSWTPSLFPLFGGTPLYPTT